MSHVTVTIAGRAYRMACDPGQEEHLLGLARVLDGKFKSRLARAVDDAAARMERMAETLERSSG